jgi:hypothetical protein
MATSCPFWQPWLLLVEHITKRGGDVMNGIDNIIANIIVNVIVNITFLVIF